MLQEVKTEDANTVCETIGRAGELAQRSLRLIGERYAKAETGDSTAVPDPLGLDAATEQFSMSLWLDPMRVARAQLKFWLRFQGLAQQTLLRSMGLDSEPVITPDPDDRRFRDDNWQDHPLFDFIKQSYLLTAQAWIGLAADSKDLDPVTHRKLDFVTRQMVDALSPTNFAMTNPEVLRETVRTGGRNLLEGMGNMLDDCERSPDRFDVSMCDQDAFELGVDLAVSPGKVVYRNELMELIQYQPTTETVLRRPLLVMPPWMNKYYILDLRPGNSMVQWLVDQGHTVFMISWVNPDASLADKGFEDYMCEGPLAALDAIEAATGEREINVMGYCLGGILLAATMAWLAAKGDQRVKSATYLTTMVDFSDVGDVGVFLDRQGFADLERKINEVGYLDGRNVAATWRAVRANDLVWSFYVNNYLLGKRPTPFDLLYWNSDSTNLPAACHNFVMRQFYLENRLAEPGGITLAGVPIDVRQVKAPAYILATRDDHIAPWKTAYASTMLFSGPKRFVLGASGHIAGVVNPPAKGKYGYWTRRGLPADPRAWIDRVTAHEGSWWPDWMAWVGRYGGGRVTARRVENSLMDAPGSYATVRLDEPANT